MHGGMAHRAAHAHAQASAAALVHASASAAALAARRQAAAAHAEGIMVRANPDPNPNPNQALQVSGHRAPTSLGRPPAAAQASAGSHPSDQRGTRQAGGDNQRTNQRRLAAEASPAARS